jgi:hypothetical protein
VESLKAGIVGRHLWFVLYTTPKFFGSKNFRNDFSESDNGGEGLFRLTKTGEMCFIFGIRA